jgi:hypothetical protein
MMQRAVVMRTKDGDGKKSKKDEFVALGVLTMGAASNVNDKKS